jgi:hypothetical protein
VFGRRAYVLLSSGRGSAKIRNFGSVHSKFSEALWLYVWMGETVLLTYIVSVIMTTYYRTYTLQSTRERGSRSYSLSIIYVRRDSLALETRDRAPVDMICTYGRG